MQHMGSKSSIDNAAYCTFRTLHNHTEKEKMILEQMQQEIFLMQVEILKELQMALKRLH